MFIWYFLLERISQLAPKYLGGHMHINVPLAPTRQVPEFKHGFG